jgi:hypothetical protein
VILTLHSERGHALYQGAPELIAAVWRRHAKAIESGRVKAALSGIQGRPALLKPQGE